MGEPTPELPTEKDLPLELKEKLAEIRRKAKGGKK